MHSCEEIELHEMNFIALREPPSVLKCCVCALRIKEI